MWIDDVSGASADPPAHVGRPQSRARLVRRRRARRVSVGPRGGSRHLVAARRRHDAGGASDEAGRQGHCAHAGIMVARWQDVAVQCVQGAELCALAALSLADKKITLVGGTRVEPAALRDVFAGRPMGGVRVAATRSDRRVAVRPAVSPDRRDVSDLDRHRHPSHVGARWEGIVLRRRAAGQLVGVSVTTRPTLHLRQPGAGTGYCRRARPDVRAEQRHHARRQTLPRRRRGRRQHRVRRARRAADSGGRALVRGAEGARADEVADALPRERCYATRR